MTESSVIKVMLIDDDTFMLMLLKQQLASCGATVRSMHTKGINALADLEASPGETDLIFLDLNMPELDGIQFIRHLVQHGYKGNLVLVSGEDERVMQTASTLVRAHKIASLGHFCKPLTPEALRTILERHRSLVPAGSGPAKKSYDADAVRAAIADGQLVNYYQPKVATLDGSVVGVEALVRWQHPADGMIYPDQFISIAEVNGLIDDLTRVVLREALRQSRAWSDAGLSLRMAVNVSMDNLNFLAFADIVTAAAQAVGVPPQNLTLEVTESRLMQDLRAPLEILSRLRLKRFRVSIDDFGTGNSSLVQLRNIPCDQLKIDRGFVHGAHSDETRRAIFNASLNLARELGIEVVAEGVEDLDDWEFLRRAHCNLAQGYFIGRPIPGAELPSWMSAWKTRLSDGLIRD
jgi:EAL domain-containing protein (putative c-di-GMP-specific phosphodiesterase class I)/DNA-binding NarL/FixJ family response regulator